jgi:esterase/lipase superfamily enzyme
VQDIRNFPRPACAGVILLAAIALSLGGCVSIPLDAAQNQAADFRALFGADEREPSRVPIFVASTRRDRDGGAPNDGAVHFSLVSVSVPPGHSAGVIERASFGSDNPRRHFKLAARRAMDETSFLGELAAHVSGRVGTSRDILLYVHGFNTSLDEARFRVAQIAADGRFSGVPVLFTWDSRGGLLAYESDKESATVARDALEKLVVDLSNVPGVGRIHILAHSMGSWLTMEALRSVAISGHPDLDGRLGEVMLAAPDIDLNVFRRQISRLDPRHVSIFVAGNDRALNISSRIAGDRPRLGALDPGNPNDRAELDRLGVAVHDLSGLSSNFDFIGHGVFAEAPAIVQQIGAQIATPRAGDADAHAVIDLRAGEPAQAASASPSAGGPSGKAIEVEALAPPGR